MFPPPVLRAPIDDQRIDCCHGKSNAFFVSKQIPLVANFTEA